MSNNLRTTGAARNLGRACDFSYCSPYTNNLATSVEVCLSFSHESDTGLINLFRLTP